MHLTQKFVEKQNPQEPRQEFRDDLTKGFGLRIAAKADGGRKSYFLHLRIGGKLFFKPLGETRDLSVKEARDKAEELRSAARKWKASGFTGPGPFADAPVERIPAKAPLFHDLVENYIQHHLHDPNGNIHHPARAEAKLRWVIGKYFKSWMDRPVDSFEMRDVITLRESAGTKQSMRRELVGFAKTLFNWCRNDEEGNVPVWPLEKNPAQGVKVPKQKPRKRYLTFAEMVQLEDALEDRRTAPDLRDFVKLALDTGARKNSLLSAKWTDVDFDSKRWHIPAANSKSGEGYDVDLVPRAMETLERRVKDRTTSEYIFPPRWGHILHLDKAWWGLLRRIGGTMASDRVTIHDLRRTCGSTLAQSGVSLQKIAAVLGHTDAKLQSVAIYAHLTKEAVSEARQTGDTYRQEQTAAARKRLESSQKTVAVLKRA